MKTVSATTYFRVPVIELLLSVICACEAYYFVNAPYFLSFSCVYKPLSNFPKFFSESIFNVHHSSYGVIFIQNVIAK